MAVLVFGPCSAVVDSVNTLRCHRVVRSSYIWYNSSVSTVATILFPLFRTFEHRTGRFIGCLRIPYGTVERRFGRVLLVVLCPFLDPK
jgi:hypothetical protein